MLQPTVNNCSLWVNLATSECCEAIWNTRQCSQQPLYCVSMWLTLSVLFATGSTVVVMEVEEGGTKQLPKTLSETLSAVNELVFPTMTCILQLLLTAPVTSASVEWASSALAYVKLTIEVPCLRTDWTVKSCSLFTRTSSLITQGSWHLCSESFSAYAFYWST